MIKGARFGGRPFCFNLWQTQQDRELKPLRRYRRCHTPRNQVAATFAGAWSSSTSSIAGTDITSNRASIARTSLGDTNGAAGVKPYLTSLVSIALRRLASAEVSWPQ